MKLYFIDCADSELKSLYWECRSEFVNESSTAIFRGVGYKRNDKNIETLITYQRGGIAIPNCIFTNDENLFTCDELFFNKETGLWDIYIWHNDMFVQIHHLTDKQLRMPHNLTKMYHAGAFERRIDWWKNTSVSTSIALMTKK